MAVTAYTYGKMNLNALKGKLPDISDAATTIKVALVSSDYIPSQNRHEVFTGPAWTALTAYEEGDYVIPTNANGNIYRCSIAGTSDTTEPAWTITDGQTIIDGGITWECFSNGDIAYFEISGTGYAAGGAEITGKILTQDGNITILSGDNVTWTESTLTARYAVIYEVSTGVLLAYQDFGENKTVENTDFAIQWNVDGILTLEVL